MRPARPLIAAGAAALASAWAAAPAAGGGTPPPSPYELPPAVDVSLDIVPPRAPLRPGERRSYRLVATNDGEGEVRRVRVFVRLPRGTKWVRGGKRQGRTVTFVKGSLGPGRSYTFRLVLRTSKRVRSVRLRGTVTAQPPEPAPAPG